MTSLRIGWIGCGTHATEMLLPQLTRHDVVPPCATSPTSASTGDALRRRRPT